MSPLAMLWIWTRSLCLERAAAATHILALRQQLAVYRHEKPRPRLKPHDRLFW